MRERVLQKLKQNKAFTLMEMMIVVALMVILLGVSVIGIVDWSKKIKMTELDNYAKSVYLEAQNQLAAMEAEGSLPKLYYNFLDEENGLYYDEYSSRKLTSTPADYNLAAFGDFYKGIYYFTSTDSITSVFVPSISTADEYGNYLIEINPQTGDVYGVFYWEKDNEYLEKKSDIDEDDDVELGTEGEVVSESEIYAQKIYAKIKNMAVKDDTNNRSLESRSEYQIGYYGGNGGDTLSTSAYKLNQEVKIVNGEELYVELSYDLNDTLITQGGQVTDQFNIEVTIKGETSKEEWVFPHVLTYDNIYEDASNGRLITGFLLDSLREGYSFEEITTGKNFTPGENLEVSVKTIYQHGGVILKEQSSIYRTNSLFHDVIDRYVEDGVNQKIERVIGVSSVRHLRNLDETYYKGDTATKINDKDIDSYVIVQKNDIDLNKGTYAFEKDARDIINYKRSVDYSIASISPIENEAIFWDANKIVTVDGNDFIIRNFVVEETIDGVTGVGLFSRAQNTHFVNVKLEDYRLSAPTNSTNTGALVGHAVDCKIEKSGVYLTASYRDEEGIKQYYSQENGEHGTKMTDRYNAMMITGGNVVGGLVGKADKTYLTDSFSAVQVKGGNTVGGLVGSVVGIIDGKASDVTTQQLVDDFVSIKNCYASGNVFATLEGAGGLIGYSENLCIDNAYATGNVKCNNKMAGFVGASFNGYYQNCYSYGEVLTLAGSEDFKDEELLNMLGVEKIIVGGFYADAKDNHGDIATLAYLSQVGYNSQDTVLVDVLLKKEYKFFTEMVSKTAPAASHPYDANLLFKAFPFKMVTEHHYGDWPIQYFINTSLVYYEKYADESYGFYSVTKLTDVSQTNADANDYVWVLDSLRDDVECKEDGYALLSMFYLDSVDYKVYQYTTRNGWKAASISTEDNREVWKTLKAEDEYLDGDNSNRMVRLMNTTALEFNAYEAKGGNKPYSENYKGEQVKSSFITNGMYLYQLPYELQNTYRYDVDNFYDVIVFNEGYAVGNTKVEDGGIAPTPVIANEVYYYCPHFSRLAINPGLGVSESANPSQFVTLAQPETVAIRTARQLNNLGRVPYYWNNRGRANDRVPYEIITYNQELDINFGTYARWKENGKELPPTYCGETYNLLAFSTESNPVEYANQPIGQNAQFSTGYGAFQNDYNGNYHKIIDYCVKSSNQYVGLFGEIYKEGGATKAQISNVVMMVSESNKGNQGNYLTADVKDQNNAGLIISNYQEQSSASGNNRQRTGVGALVGSDYTLGLTDGEAKIFTIYNCASAGYQVQYHIEPVRANCQQPLGVALGGMIGYSRGNVAQSTATNDVKLVAKDSVTGDNAAFMLGGFTGSAFFGTTLNCYAGGTIDVDDSNGTCYVNRLRIGGFCPGWMYAKGVVNEKNDEDVRFQNIYSYTEVKERVWSVRESSRNDKVFSHLIPTVSRMRLNYSSGSWHTESENGSNAVRVPGFSYYLNTVITKVQLDRNGSDAKGYYQYVAPNILHWADDRPKTCDPATYDELSNSTWVNSNKQFGKTVSFVSTEWYDRLVYIDDPAYQNYVVPITSDLVGQKYTFPMFVRDANGQFVHYGDWPLKP